MKKKINLLKKGLWGIFDDDNDLRYTFLYLDWALTKKKEIGWGEIYEIRVKKIRRVNS